MRLDPKAVVCCGLILGVFASFQIIRAPQTAAASVSANSIEEGDILLFKSSTWRSLSVSFLQFGSEGFGHAGIARKGVHGLEVIHSDPRIDPRTGRDGVRVNDLQDLIDRYKIHAVVAIRPTSLDRTQIRKAVAAAMRLASQGIPFDHSFDLGDAKEVYCTELLTMSFGTGPTELLHGTTSGRYFLPDQLLDVPGLEIVYEINP